MVGKLNGFSVELKGVTISDVTILDVAILGATISSISWAGFALRSIAECYASQRIEATAAVSPSLRGALLSAEARLRAKPDATMQSI